MALRHDDSTINIIVELLIIIIITGVQVCTSGETVLRQTVGLNSDVVSRGFHSELTSNLPALSPSLLELVAALFYIHKHKEHLLIQLAHTTGKVTKTMHRSV